MKVKSTLFMAISLAILSGSCFAESAPCTLDYGYGDPLHTSCLRGANPTGVGHWIKTVTPTITSTSCETNYVGDDFGTNSIAPDDVADFHLQPGLLHFTYYLCDSEAGTNCTLAGEDSFTLRKDSSGQYSASPPTHIVDISVALKSTAFPTCSDNK